MWIGGIQMKKIAILTGGGDCPGLNAVIRAIVKTAKKKYNLEVVGYKDGYRGLVENWQVPLEIDDVVGIIERVEQYLEVQTEIILLLIERIKKINQ